MRTTSSSSTTRIFDLFTSHLQSPAPSGWHQPPGSLSSPFGSSEIHPPTRTKPCPNVRSHSQFLSGPHHAWFTSLFIWLPHELSTLVTRGEEYGKRRPYPFLACHPDFTPAGLDNTMTDRQTQAPSFPDPLRAKEWVKDLL